MSQSNPSDWLLIDCDEDRVLRAVLVGMLREAFRQSVATARSRATPETANAINPANRMGTTMRSATFL